jgi:hypothetical protein
MADFLNDLMADPLFQTGIAGLSGRGQATGLKAAQDNRLLQAQQQEMQRAEQTRQVLGDSLGQGGGKLTLEAIAPLANIDPMMYIQLYKQVQLQQQEAQKQEMLGRAFGGGGGTTGQVDPAAIAGIGALNNDPQLMGLATFMQGQQNRTTDEQNRLASEERTQARQLSAEERARQDKIETEQRDAAEKGAQFYATKLEDSGLTELYQQVKGVKALLPEKGKDIPGFGYGVGTMPDILVSQTGVDLRQAIAGVRNGILKARSGGAVTPAEAERLLTELGEGAFKSDAQLRKGLASVERTLNAKIQNFAAGVTPRALEEYKSRGGEILPASKIPDGVTEAQWNAMKPEEQAEWQ